MCSVWKGWVWALEHSTLGLGEEGCCSVGLAVALGVDVDVGGSASEVWNADVGGCVGKVCVARGEAGW